MVDRRWRVHASAAVLLVWCLVLDGADAIKRDAKRSRYGDKDRHDRQTAKLSRHRMDLYKKLLKYVFAGVLFPILASFVHSLCTDPAVPQILRRAVEAAHQKFSTRLSTRRAKSR